MATVGLKIISGNSNARLAKSEGVPSQLTGQNGDLFMLSPQRGVRRAFAATGRLGLDRRSLVKIPDQQLPEGV